MRTISPAELSRVLTTVREDRPRVVAAGNASTPWHLVDVVDRSIERYALFMLNAALGVPDRDGVDLESPFMGPGMRHSPRGVYIPARLSLVPSLLRSSFRPDIVLLHTTPARHGRVSLGIEVNILPAAIEAVRARGGIVIAQLNPAVPWTFGDAEIDVSCIDYGITVDEPLRGPAHRPTPPVARAVGRRVASLIDDGATLQLGIGGVPDATLASVTDRRDLRVWSEMVSDGIVHLDKAGALDASAPMVASFLLGSSDLYAWADRNERLQLLRTETTNDPSRIAAQRNLTSINTALQVDLYGQANASWVRRRIWSGFGGQSDFVVGALHAVGGRAIIALPSWHPRADTSTIVPLLDNPVTSFQHSHVVSEQGTATVFAESRAEQAHQLIENVAHPRAREELRAHVHESSARAESSTARS